MFRKDPVTNKVTHYETYRPQTNFQNPNSWESVLRYNGIGKGHTNKIFEIKIETPHMHDPLCPGGVRPVNNWEIPR